MMRHSVLALTLSVLFASNVSATTTSKTEDFTYYDNTTLWVLGQTATVKCMAALPVASTACNGDDVESATTFDANAMPWTISTFGQVQSTMTYETTLAVASGQRGTLKTVADGKGNTTTLTSWYRGIPQLVAFPTSPVTSKSAVVDDNGWVLSVTDEVFSKTCYGYDPMGRLSGITYTSESSTNTCDGSPSAAWKPMTRAFVTLSAGEYGMVAGQWRETVTTGNAVKVTYYDAMWRPVLTREYDSSSVPLSASEHFVKTTYDAGGRILFVSYPSATSAPDKGSWTYYDPLGRVSSQSQDSELGVLTTTTTYNTGFTTTVTNPRTKATTTSYQTYDQPSTDAPVSISLPEGVMTTITRDPFGKPLSITRSGTGG